MTEKRRIDYSIKNIFLSGFLSLIRAIATTILFVVGIASKAQLRQTVNLPQGRADYIYPDSSKRFLLTVNETYVAQWDLQTGFCVKTQPTAGRMTKAKISETRRHLILLEDQYVGKPVIEIFQLPGCTLVSKIFVDSLLAGSDGYGDSQIESFAFDESSGWLGATTFTKILFANIRTGKKFVTSVTNGLSMSAIAFVGKSWFFSGEDNAERVRKIWRIQPDDPGPPTALVTLNSTAGAQEMIGDVVTGSLFVVYDFKALLRVHIDAKTIENVSNPDEFVWTTIVQYFWSPEERCIYFSTENGCFRFSFAKNELTRVLLTDRKNVAYRSMSLQEESFFFPYDLSQNLFVEGRRSTGVSLFTIDSMVLDAGREVYYSRPAILHFGNEKMIPFSSIRQLADGSYLLENVNDAGIMNADRLSITKTSRDIPLNLVQSANSLTWLGGSQRLAMPAYENPLQGGTKFKLVLFNAAGYADSTWTLPVTEPTPVYAGPDSDTLYIIGATKRTVTVYAPTGQSKSFSLPDSTAVYAPTEGNRFLKLPNGHFVFAADLVLDCNPYSGKSKVIDRCQFSESRILTIDAIREGVLMKVKPRGSAYYHLIEYFYNSGDTLALMNGYPAGEVVQARPFTWKGAPAWLVAKSWGRVEVRSSDFTQSLFEFVIDANATITDLLVDESRSLIAVLLTDYSMRLLDRETFRQLSRLYFNEHTGNLFAVAIDSAQNYFMAAGQSSMINWVRNGQPYAFSVFDKYFNQPATVLSEIHSRDTSYISLLSKATQLRRNRSKRDIGPASIDALPVCTIETDAHYTTSNSYADVTITISAKSNAVTRWQIYANGIPLLYLKKSMFAGPLVPGRDTSFVYRLALPGEITTRISVRAFDDANNASLPVERPLYCFRQERGGGHIWYLGIGTSRYRDSSFNLHYAAKDVDDIREKIKLKVDDIYRGGSLVITDTLVTIENIIKGFAWLADKAAIDDEVWISFSGHGVTSRDGKFYVMLYNSDFRQPEKTALPFEGVFEMLKIIPCRNKLVLIDACESGDYDKEGYVTSQKPPEQITLDAPPGSKGVIIENNGISPASTYLEVMKDYFADLESESAATIIGAASGKSVALENNQWQNGIFSYTFMQGIFQFAADLNHDGKITISEINTYMREKVSQATGGYQRPSVRNMDLRNDWILVEKNNMRGL